jgi:hypothetical protein
MREVDILEFLLNKTVRRGIRGTCGLPSGLKTLMIDRGFVRWPRRAVGGRADRARDPSGWPTISACKWSPKASNAEQVIALQCMRCDAAQGYLIAKRLDQRARPVPDHAQPDRKTGRRLVRMIGRPASKTGAISGIASAEPRAPPSPVSPSCHLRSGMAKAT